MKKKVAAIRATLASCKSENPMAEFFYREFWQECGTHGLTKEQKVKLLKMLCDFSLKYPYWNYGERDLVGGQTLREWFPVLVPSALCKKHAHSDTLSGLMLYVIHTEIGKELLKVSVA